MQNFGGLIQTNNAYLFKNEWRNMSDQRNLMKTRLEMFLQEHGLKHWSFAARKDSEFCAWVTEQTQTLPAEIPFADRVYAAVHDDPPICHRGGMRKLNSIEKGWRFCGRAGACACARESVQSACKDKIGSKSKDEWAGIITKRRETNLQKYGVANAAQTERARAAHQAFYADPEKVAAANAKVEETMLERYGVRSGLNLPIVNEIRPTIAASLSESAKENRRRLQKEHAANGRLLKSAYVRLKAKFETLGYEWLTEETVYNGVYGDGRERFPFRCKTCTTEFDDYIYDGAVPVCPHCYPTIPKYVSGEETAVADFVESLGVSVIRSSRKHLGDGTELDIILPDHGIAIEYGGLYFHSEKSSGKAKQYHRTKMEKCAEKGLRLITMFSDEWLFHRDAVQNRLRQIIGVGSLRIYARKTECRQIDHASAKAFLEQHHLQGYGRTPTARYGLFSGETLVAVMTFGPLRRSNNHTPSLGDWELYRFASTGTVVGGASKMFAAFLREHDPKSVISFCDLRWGTGGVYEKIGFEKIGTTAPSYAWVEKHSIRHNRYSFRKQRLIKEGFPSNQTEEDIMFGRGFDRIWDCGHAKFVWKPHK